MSSRASSPSSGSWRGRISRSSNSGSRSSSTGSGWWSNRRLRRPRPEPPGQGRPASRATLTDVATQERTRNLGRLSEIAQVAVKHGFGYFLETHRLTDLLPWHKKVLTAEDGSRPQRGQHLREMLDELGPTFVKFGQVLSTRPDIVPPDIIVELRGLQDDVRPFAFEDVERVVREDLRLSLDKLF